MPFVQLQNDSAYPGDQGFGKARLDPETMLTLKVCPGDIVAIEGTRRTVAIVWRSLVEDWNQNKIRIDKYTRHNAGVGIGDTVTVLKITEEMEAKRVVFVPLDEFPELIPRGVSELIDFPILKDDIVPIDNTKPYHKPQIVEFKVMEIEPEEATLITKNTSVEFLEKPATGFRGLKCFSYEDIGGLNDQIKQIREIIDLPVLHPELFQRLGIEPPKGILLYGPSGTGKTLIGKVLANESGRNFIAIAGPEIISKYYGESEQRIREVFEEARENAPSTIFIDELGSIAQLRGDGMMKETHCENTNNEDACIDVERRVIAQLITMMDGLEERGDVIVVGAVRRIDLIEPALRRSGRFDREIEIGLPNELARIEILKIHTRNMPLSHDIRLENLAQQTNGFSGADLVELCKEAALCAYKRCISEESLESLYDKEISDEILNTVSVSPTDFQEVLGKINNKIINRNN